MEQAERDKLELAAVNAAIAEALLAAGAKTSRVLTPHLRAATRVKWDGDNPMVVAQIGSKETTLDHFVTTLKMDPDFKHCFFQPPDPTKRDSDGIRRVSVLDQQAMNKYASEIAAGTCEVIYPEETRKKLDDDQVDRKDQGALNANLEKIASGEVTVVG